ncbi:cleft lip and palate transmembrane protein [Rhizophagus irregularis]|uniref:Cleft lip and palate transmembrane protein n=1 Tax=Rhizophagus irregularis TaxID=588596 RepID=A0A2I1G2X8_9GLOM|nr:cleft lip and palate transmembrane protein [Rhizophagus irregularis]
MSTSPPTTDPITDVQTTNNEQNVNNGNDNARQQQQQQQQQQEQPWQSIMQVIIRMMIIYYIISFFRGSQNNQTSVPSTSKSDISHVQVTSNFTPSHLYPSWPLGSNMNLCIYVSEDENFTDFKNLDARIWYSSVLLGNWDEERDESIDIQTSVNVQNNGTLYAHIYLTLEKASPDPLDPAYQENLRVYQRKLLTRYYPKRKMIKTKNLISNDDQDEKVEEETKPDTIPIISYWYKNLTINIVSDNHVIPYNQLQPLFKSYIELDKTTLVDPSSKAGYYLPTLFVNDFWLIREHLTPINETVKTLPLNIKYYPISAWKLQLYVQMGESFRTQAEMMGGDAHSEFDEIKRMLRETNPILLGVTFTVSILHSVFEFLAFKNDIAHWRNKEELTGVSVRTILANIFFQLIIFLYLMDNNEDTSWMILIGQGISLAIEVWKIKKAVDIEIKPSQSFFKYSINFIDKHKLSESEEKTKEYDRLAFRYLSWIAFPLLIAYAIYSLIYNTHKSWYSFVLTTLVGFVYAFGFIMMTPQFFINYKLKSVAHMPWKTLMYKTLGTFVDDLFAFCIKMPTLHRLACLRDDVIFFVYLYQKWKYPVDNKRANEYGQVAQDSREEVEQIDQTESKKDK